MTAVFNVCGIGIPGSGIWDLLLFLILKRITYIIFYKDYNHKYYEHWYPEEKEAIDYLDVLFFHHIEHYAKKVTDYPMPEPIPEPSVLAVHDPSPITEYAIKAPELMSNVANMSQLYNHIFLYMLLFAGMAVIVAYFHEDVIDHYKAKWDSELIRELGREAIVEFEGISPGLLLDMLKWADMTKALTYEEYLHQILAFFNERKFRTQVYFVFYNLMILHFGIESIIGPPWDYSLWWYLDILINNRTFIPSENNIRLYLASFKYPLI